MEIKELGLDDMKSSGFGASSWDHEELKDFLQDAYEERAENDGDTVVIGFGTDTVNKYYDGRVEEQENTNANVVKQLKSIVEESGFSPVSQIEGRKSPVGSESSAEGVLFKVELTPY